MRKTLSYHLEIESKPQLISEKSDPCPVNKLACNSSKSHWLTIKRSR